MKFLSVDVNEVVSLGSRTHKWDAELQEFINSEAKEIEVVDDTGSFKDYNSLAVSIKSTIARNQYNIRCFTKKSRVFIVKPESVLY